MNEIARRLDIRKATVIDWLKRESYLEGRGWKQGRRSHTVEEEKRIAILKRERIEGKKYFLGTPHVRMDYAKRFPNDPLPSLWFVNDVVRRHGLQTHEPRKRSKGQNIVSRLKFPIQSIIRLGRIQQAADFIGKKFIAGRKEPISIFSTSYYQWLGLYQIWRVSSEKAENAIACLTGFWRRFPIPDVMRMDNGMSFRGTGRGEAHVGRCVVFLLNRGVIPLFSSPYQSYTNPHIEGHNRTFTEKLWSAERFTSHGQIDEACARFNAESEEFCRWSFKDRLNDHQLRFLPERSEPQEPEILRSAKGKKICFIRFVERWKERGDECGVVILNRFVRISDPYLNQYVFVTLDLETASIYVTSEHDGHQAKILQRRFPYSL